MTRMKLVLWGLLGLLIVFGLGWAYGASGRREVARQAEENALRASLAEGRTHILEARVSLYNNNFGDASGELEQARDALERVHQTYRDRSDEAAASSIGTAIERIGEAQKLANKLDPTANARAADALRALAVIR